MVITANERPRLTGWRDALNTSVCETNPQKP
jgi:hypothetical protein